MDTSVAIVAIIALSISIVAIATVAIVFGLRFKFKVNPKEVHFETKPRGPISKKDEINERKGL